LTAKEIAVATDFTGKTALITGAGRGIGRSVALGLAGAGARVVLLARTAAQLEETRALLRERGVDAGRISVVRADLADEDDRGRAAADALAAGRVDILVNNAAVVEPLGPTIGIAAADLRLAFEVNVVAPAALAAAVLPGMLDAGWGRVVNVSSGIVANPAGMIRGNAYAATKAALEAHTVNLAAELAGTGVTVNVYRPGGVDTAMQAWIRRQDPGRIGALHERFNRNFTEGTLITPDHSAAGLLAHLTGDDTGAIWDVSTAPAGV
jgi:NAD(P)-dependent dehydrogenase (short-subunit alcohol dehydrogenase family)